MMARQLLLGTALQSGLTFLAALATPAGAQPAPNARPAGGTVVAGSAMISTSPATTTISQSSQRAAVNWQSFNVGSKQTVDLDAPTDANHAAVQTLLRIGCF